MLDAPIHALAMFILNPMMCSCGGAMADSLDEQATSSMVEALVAQISSDNVAVIAESLDMATALVQASSAKNSATSSLLSKEYVKVLIETCR